jgi:5-methyltetrahydrofolate--homocysteine methyltransferase
LVALTPLRKPLLVGEQINATGSRRVLRMLLRGDYAAIAGVGRRQQEAGAGALDVSTIVPGLAGEAERMAAVLAEIRRTSDMLLLIDSIDPEVQVRGLKTAATNAVVNSINLAQRDVDLDRVIGAVLGRQAGVVLQTIDERGMARTSADKLELARAGVGRLVEHYDLSPGSLIIDPLLLPLFPVTKSRLNPAVETLDGLRQIKAVMPDLRTILGISNLSFGLPPAARPLINSVFLHHAALAGLDLAIVDPARVTDFAAIPQGDRLLGEDLLFRRRPDALARYLRRFERYGTGTPMAGISAADAE